MKDATHGPDAAADIEEKAQSTETRSQRPTSEAFKKFIATGWSAPDPTLPELLPAAEQAVARRAALSAQYPGQRLVIPAGGHVVRSNDTDHRFRPHTAFTYFTGLGVDREPDAVLVMAPTADGHEAQLFFRPRSPRDSEEFYASARYGELWIGSRQSLAEIAAETGLEALHLDGLEAAITGDLADVEVRIVADAATDLTQQLNAARDKAGTAGEETVKADEAFAAAISTMRLVKSDWEVDQLRSAMAATADGFDDIIAALPRAIGHERGERVIEGVFAARAREMGNGQGYDAIAASGAHTCTLHWIRNDGPVRDGDLLLVDAGVEVQTLYTADITRTIPVSGRFTPAQRRVYEVVREAADAAMSQIKPGSTLAGVHEAAMRVIAERLGEWGLLPVDVEEVMDREKGGQHRRWVVHGTSHHLGLDVHDCALADRELYIDGELTPGMVFTVEPGLYFRPDDELVPAELRGIGVRIEDDIVVTAGGYENLSGMLPRHPDDVEAWVTTGRR